MGTAGLRESHWEIPEYNRKGTKRCPLWMLPEKRRAASENEMRLCPGPSLLFFKWKRAFDLWKNGNAHCCFYCTGNNVKQLQRESREVKNSLIPQLHGGGKVAGNPRGPDPQDLVIPTCLSQRRLFRTETQTPQDPSLISFCHCSVAQLYPTLCDPEDCI